MEPIWSAQAWPISRASFSTLSGVLPQFMAFTLSCASPTRSFCKLSNGAPIGNVWSLTTDVVPNQS